MLYTCLQSHLLCKLLRHSGPWGKYSCLVLFPQNLKHLQSYEGALNIPSKRQCGFIDCKRQVERKSGEITPNCSPFKISRLLMPNTRHFSLIKNRSVLTATFQMPWLVNWYQITTRLSDMWQKRCGQINKCVCVWECACVCDECPWAILIYCIIWLTDFSTLLTVLNWLCNTDGHIDIMPFHFSPPSHHYYFYRSFHWGKCSSTLGAFAGSKVYMFFPKPAQLFSRYTGFLQHSATSVDIRT